MSLTDFKAKMNKSKIGRHVFTNMWVFKKNFCIWSVSLLISCLYLSYLTLHSCFVFVLLLLLILYLLILDLFNKETSKGWVCDNFPRQFHFFLGAIHEKHKFKYFKNLTVKVCKIWCNDVYMSILQCDIFNSCV
jgi:hypothetical protein